MAPAPEPLIFTAPPFLVAGHSAVLRATAVDCRAPTIAVSWGRRQLPILSCAGDRLVVAVPDDLAVGIARTLELVAGSVAGTAGAPSRVIAFEVHYWPPATGSTPGRVVLEVAGTRRPVELAVRTVGCLGRGRWMAERTGGGSPNRIMFFCRPIGDAIRLQIRLPAAGEVSHAVTTPGPRTR